MLDKKTTAVVAAIQLFDKLDHTHCWQLWNFSSSKSGLQKINRSKVSCIFNMLFIRADFCRPLRFINSAILFIFLTFRLVVLLLIVSRFLHIKHWVFLKQRFFFIVVIDQISSHISQWRIMWLVLNNKSTFLTLLHFHSLHGLILFNCFNF